MRLPGESKLSIDPAVACPRRVPNSGLYLSQTQGLRLKRSCFLMWFQARRAAAMSFFLTHSVLDSPEDLMADSISAYSGGESLVEMNLPRFSLFGSAGLPTFGVSLIYFGFLASGGGGVLSKAFKASLNETPLRFGSITFAGRFRCFARFGSGTDSLSPPTHMRGFWFYKAILLAAKPAPSNCLLIR